MYEQYIESKVNEFGKKKCIQIIEQIADELY